MDNGPNLFAGGFLGVFLYARMVLNPVNWNFRNIKYSLVCWSIPFPSRTMIFLCCTFALYSEHIWLRVEWDNYVLP
jgi:hypothetical protein